MASGADLQQVADAADNAQGVLLAEVFGLDDEGHEIRSKVKGQR